MNYGRVGRPEAKSTGGGNGQTSRPIVRNATTMGPSDGTMHTSSSAAAAPVSTPKLLAIYIKFYGN
jgi:hypothetical protein